ncbi:hypothetical protein Btru_033363 [Bulinus truncatus]|nr:hypothetical protein Btru_033363 [Bulinus truncatus]
MYRTLAILLAVLGYSQAFPSGAHNNHSNIMDSFSSHCTAGNLRPQHGNNLPQHSPAPYNITVSSPGGAMYKPGQPVSITISGTGAQKFKGFFLFGDCTEASFAGDIICGDQGHNVSYCGRAGATHNNAVEKAQVVCQWMPPDYQIGRVQFVATVVQKFDTFWTGLKSGTILEVDPSTMTYEQKTIQLRNLMLARMGNAGASGFPNVFNNQGQGNPCKLYKCIFYLNFTMLPLCSPRAEIQCRYRNSEIFLLHLAFVKKYI